MRTIQTGSRMIACSCHSETAVHARLRARSTARPRTPLALMLSGLIVIGSIAPPAADTAYATKVAKDTWGCGARAAQATAKSGLKHGNLGFSGEESRISQKYIQDATDGFDLFVRTFNVEMCYLAPN
jgi:hypothetical protein